MAWRIDRDYIDTGADSAVGTSQGELEGDTFGFRLADDDLEVYYHGIADAAAAADDELYGGLYEADRWGTWNAGTVRLEVRARDAIAHGLYSQAGADREGFKPDEWILIYA
jgi:hypothetical protein